MGIFLHKRSRNGHSINGLASRIPHDTSIFIRLDVHQRREEKKKKKNVRRNTKTHSTCQRGWTPASTLCGFIFLLFLFFSFFNRTEREERDALVIIVPTRISYWDGQPGKAAANFSPDARFFLSASSFPFFIRSCASPLLFVSSTPYAQSTFFRCYALAKGLENGKDGEGSPSS